MHRVRAGTATGVIGGGGIRHVALMVGAVEIDTIPAGGKEDLSTKTIWAVGGREVWCFRCCGSVIIQTSIGDGLGCKIGSAASFERIAGDHSESFGEGLERLSSPVALQVINRCTSDLLDRGKRSILKLIKEVRGPVVGHVSFDSARGACRCLGLRIGHGEPKGVASHDGVNMAGHLSRCNDRISALDDERGFAWQAPESCDRRGCHREQAERRQV